MLGLPFAFSVLIYNSTNDSCSELISEEERFNSTQYSDNEPIMLYIDDVELDQFYCFAAKALNMFGMSEISPISDPILLNVSGMPTFHCIHLRNAPNIQLSQAA